MEYKKILEQITTEGGPPGEHKTPGRARPPRRALVGCAQPSPPPVPIFWYKVTLDLKNRGGLSGRSAAASRRNLGRSTFALRRSDSAGGTSLPKGEIEAIDITNDPLIVGGPIFINIFNSTISSQTVVHLLYSIFVSKPQISTCGLL